jgi:hypothetical protein
MTCDDDYYDDDDDRVYNDGVVVVMFTRKSQEKQQIILIQSSQKYKKTSIPIKMNIPIPIIITAPNQTIFSLRGGWELGW